MPMALLKRVIALFISIIASGAWAAGGLPETRIKFVDAAGITPPTTSIPAPCPFLTDRAAFATVETRFKLLRRRVSNTRCVWSKNMAMRLDVFVEPLKLAKPFRNRHYDIDRKTQVKTLDGPGKNAVLLSQVSGGKPVVYALGFELGDQAVFIRATGLPSSQAMMLQAAREIATRLPTAARIDQQFRRSVPVFDTCTIWNQGQVLALLGLPMDTRYTSQRIGNGCSISARLTKPRRRQLNLYVGFFAMSEDDWKRRAEAGAVAQDNYEIPVQLSISEKRHFKYFLLTGRIGDRAVSVSIADSQKEDQTAPTRLLFDNLIQRLTY